MSPLSLDRASAIMGALWRDWLPFRRRNTRALANLAHALPELDEAARRAAMADIRENFGRVFIEAFRLEDLAAQPERFDLSAVEPLRELADSGQGAVLASLHQGNWEACTTAAGLLGIATAGIYRELTNPIVEDYLAAIRGPHYPLGLFCKRTGSDVARKALSLVKSGGTIAILADLRDDDGVHLNFLGQPSSANLFPAFVARVTGAPLIAARLKRVGGVRFRAEAIRIEVPRTADRQADIETATRNLSAVFEDWVRDAPEQWLWTHRKWELPEDRRRATAP